MAVEFEEAEDDDIELVVEGQEEEVVDDGNTVISKADLKRLSDAADDRAMLRESLQGLQAITKPQPANQALPEKYETEEEFRKRFASKYLTDGQEAEAVYEAIDRRIAGFVGHAENTFTQLQRTIAAKDEATGSVMQKYPDEIEAELQKIPRIERTTKAGIDRAVMQVKMNHIDDLVAERVAAELAKLSGGEEVDDEPRRGGVVRKPSADAGRMVAPQKRKVVVTEQLRAEARRNHYGDDVAGWVRQKQSMGM